MANTNGMREALMKEFSENYMEQVYYFCLKKTGDSYEAEDLAQDIALNILTALHGGTVPESFSGWVWQIARNRYSKWAARKHRHGESVTGSDISDYEIEDESDSILDEMIHADDLALLRRELAFISGEYRNIVTAFYIEDRSIRDIAATLKLPESAVKQRLYRARKILKEGMNMAREFGKLSYKPENINFTMNGYFGSNGEPWNYLNRLLCRNIMLAAYRTPSTAEELAIEVGVALPYMEEELADLTKSTLMKKNGDKYETNIFIVSRAAQEKMLAHQLALIPDLTDAIIEAVEYAVNWKNENCPGWHEGYQPYEDMKWTLLMQTADKVRWRMVDKFNAERVIPESATANTGKWGLTKRPNGGEWDVLGKEQFIDPQNSCGIGLHGCLANARERDLPEIDFGQFKFFYKKIDKKTPNSLTYSEGQALVAVAKGKPEEANESMLANLVKYGYIEKTETGYKPTLLVCFNEKNKDINDGGKYNALLDKAVDIAMRQYLFSREQISREIPDFLKDDIHQIDHACSNIFNIRGAVLEEALYKGYINYEKDDPRKMLGAYLNI